MYDESVQNTQPLKLGTYFYFGLLILAFQFGSPGGALISIPVSFFLKNRLDLTASEVATFFFWVSVPFYLSFLFGVIRDSVDPFRIGDRGFYLIFGSLTAIIFTTFAFAGFSYLTAFFGMLLATASFLFLWSAWHGSATEIAQAKNASSNFSVLKHVLSGLPTVLSILAGGAFSQYLEAKQSDNAFRLLFVTAAAICAGIAIVGSNPPRSAVMQSTAKPARAMTLRSFTGLFHHRQIYAPLAIWGLWNFAPGLETAMQYHLTNTLHLDDAQYGVFNAIYFGSYVPTYILYGILSKRVANDKLWKIAAYIGTLQMLPLLFAQSSGSAFLAASTMGLLGGMATAAFSDLLIRKAPTKFEASMMMLSMSLMFVAMRAGDVAGTILYDNAGGFISCVISTTLVYIAILPILNAVTMAASKETDGTQGGRKIKHPS